MEAKIFKEVNSLVWSIELYENSEYISTTYCRYKYEAVQYCKENDIKINN